MKKDRYKKDIRGERARRFREQVGRSGGSARFENDDVIADLVGLAGAALDALSEARREAQTNGTASVAFARLADDTELAADYPLACYVLAELEAFEEARAGGAWYAQSPVGKEATTVFLG